jgi:hypothetical protein
MFHSKWSIAQAEKYLVFDMAFTAVQERGDTPRCFSRWLIVGASRQN